MQKIQTNKVGISRNLQMRWIKYYLGTMLRNSNWRENVLQSLIYIYIHATIGIESKRYTDIGLKLKGFQIHFY